MRQILRYHTVIADRTPGPGIFESGKVEAGVKCLGEAAVINDRSDNEIITR